MRYESSTAYMTHEELAKHYCELVEQLTAEARSRERRPDPMIIIPVPLPEEPIFDGDYG